MFIITVIYDCYCTNLYTEVMLLNHRPIVLIIPGIQKKQIVNLGAKLLKRSLSACTYLPKVLLNISGISIIAKYNLSHKWDA